MPRAWENIEAFATPSQSVNWPQGPFFGARVEQHERYDIFWFVWDRDGIIPKSIIPEDWEPIILYWHGNDLVRVTVRLHYEWIDYSSPNLDEPHFSLPVEVIFTGSNHGPWVRKKDDTIFDTSVQSYIELEPDYQSIKEDDVPAFARKGFINRRGILISAGQDIHARAEETLSELDEIFQKSTD